MDQSGRLKSRKNLRNGIMHVTASQLQGSQLRVNSGLRRWIHTQGRTERVRGVQQKLSRSVKTFWIASGLDGILIQNWSTAVMTGRDFSGWNSDR